MPSQMNEIFGHFILTQKSIHQLMPYDLVETIIQDAVNYVKKENINARIANIVLNIDNKLVLAQIYVERQNGFAPTKDNKYGTTPVSYRVQLRFPFGLEINLDQTPLFLPPGEFYQALQPYQNTVKICDDVQRDFAIGDIVLGPGTHKTLNPDGTITLSCMPDGESVTFAYQEDIGKGFSRAYGTDEYYHFEDYELRLKRAGVTPLFYFEASKPSQGILRYFDHYPGFTRHQHDTFEAQNQEAPQRKKDYEDFIRTVNHQILATEAGQRWFNDQASSQKKYLFDLTILNGMTLFTQTGQPVIRLRDYQLKLFQNCLQFIESTHAPHQTFTLKRGLSGVINMGVGAGKTFFTFTLLQHLKQTLQHRSEPIAPPFCIAPDIAVAEVTATSINRQGNLSGTTAIAITSIAQMPSRNFSQFYKTLTHHAQQEAQEIERYLNEGLQEEILAYCQHHHLHPLQMINHLGNKYSDADLETRMSTFKDSIDVKRLLLMVEGQKTLLHKTGMMSTTALKNLLEQFTALKEGVEKEKNLALFQDAQHSSEAIPALNINYNQTVELPNSLKPALPLGTINLANITQQELQQLLEKKYRHSQTREIDLRAIRDVLTRIACLGNKNAAVILANSGGLGNTYTQAQIKEHINKFLPEAVTQLRTLACQNTHTSREHYKMYMYLNELFSTIPNKINLHAQLDSQNIKRETFQNNLYIESLKDNIQLIDVIKTNIEQKINQLSTVDHTSSADPMMLQRYGISEKSTTIDAANQLASVASLEITGIATGDNVQLLLTHIPVFTPEGLACYFEHLASKVGQPKIYLEASHRIYSLKTPDELVTQKDVADRLTQILNAMMIADEIHKKPFEFLYDTNHPVYHRINQITEKFLGQSFCDVLPHRIGMSGTINDSAEKAFGENVLYQLSIQKMINQALTKKIAIGTQEFANEFDSSNHSFNQQEYAKRVLIDYFAPGHHLTIENILNVDHDTIELYQLSKGIIFSKIPNSEFNRYLLQYFNLLISENLSHEDKMLQDELLNRINKKRADHAALLQSKLAGKTALSQADLEQITLYHRSTRLPITLTSEGKLNQPPQRPASEVIPLDVLTLRKQHRAAFHNHLFALYLEYILSKSNAKKECSDIIGLQNRLAARGCPLINIATLNADRDVANILALMDSVDPKSINEEDLHLFIDARIKNQTVQKQWITTILAHKNNYRTFAPALIQATASIELPALITTSRSEFESGTVMAMLGSEHERTGYSHEPLGIVVDAPTPIDNLLLINEFADKLASKQLEKNQLKPFLDALHELIHNTLSYDEKNQAGGRILRTPYGEAKFVQYQTKLNALISACQKTDAKAILALKLETSFEDIFTSDEELAQKERVEITFNRVAFSLLKLDHTNIHAFYESVYHYFRKELQQEQIQNQYMQYITDRLPLLWALKYESELAINYFIHQDDSIFNTLKTQMVLPSEPPQASHLSTPSAEGIELKNSLKHQNDYKETVSYSCLFYFLGITATISAIVLFIGVLALLRSNLIPLGVGFLVSGVLGISASGHGLFKQNIGKADVIPNIVSDLRIQY